MGQLLTLSNMRSVLLFCVLFISATLQAPPMDELEEIENSDFNFRDECSSHCVDAYYDDSSEWHDKCSDWCYQQYFYDDVIASDRDGDYDYLLSGPSNQWRPHF